MDNIEYQEFNTKMYKKKKKTKHAFWKGLLIGLSTTSIISILAAGTAIGVYAQKQLSSKVEKVSEAKKSLYSELFSAKRFLNSFNSNDLKNPSLKKYHELLNEEISKTEVLLSKLDIEEEYYYLAVSSLIRIKGAVLSYIEQTRVAHIKFEQALFSNTTTREMKREILDDPSSLYSNFKEEIRNFFAKYEQLYVDPKYSKEDMEENLNNFSYEWIDKTQKYQKIKPQKMLLKKFENLLFDAKKIQSFINKKISLITSKYTEFSTSYQFNEIWLGQISHTIKTLNDEIGSLRTKENLDLGCLWSRIDEIKLSLLDIQNKAQNYFYYSIKIFDFANSIINYSNQNEFTSEQKSAHIVKVKEYTGKLKNSKLNIQNLEENLSDLLNYFASVIVERNEKHYSGNFEDYKKYFIDEVLRISTNPNEKSNYRFDPWIKFLLQDDNDANTIISTLDQKVKELKTKSSTWTNQDHISNAFKKYKSIIIEALIAKEKKNTVFANCINLDQFFKAELDTTDSKRSPDLYKYIFEQFANINSEFISKYEFPKNMDVSLDKYQRFYDDAIQKYKTQVVDFKNSIEESLFKIYDIDVNIELPAGINSISEILPSKIKKDFVKIINVPSANIKYDVMLYPNDFYGTIMIEIIPYYEDLVNNKKIHLLSQQVFVTKRGFQAIKNKQLLKPAFKAKNDGVMLDLLTYSKYLKNKNNANLNIVVHEKLKPILEFVDPNKEIRFIDICFEKDNVHKMQYIYQIVQKYEVYEWQNNELLPAIKELLSPIFIAEIDYSKYINNNLSTSESSSHKLNLLNLVNGILEWKVENKLLDLSLIKPEVAQLTTELDNAISIARNKLLEKGKNKDFFEAAYKVLNTEYERIKVEFSKI